MELLETNHEAADVMKEDAPDTGQDIPQENLNLWLKADTGVIKTDGSVSSWENQAGGDLFSTINGTGGITLQQSNGYDYMQFDGTDSLHGVTIDYNGKSEITLMVVAEYEGEDPIRNSYSDINTALFWTESGDWGTMSLAPYKEQIMMRFGTGAESGVSRFDKATNEISINTAIKNGDTHTLVLNGTEVLSEAGKVTTTSGIGTDMYVGMGISAGNNRYFTGKIAEVIAYDRVLTPDETTQVYDYLSDKYNIGVTEKEPLEIVISPPDKLEYNIGDIFDPQGMKVSLKYSDGSMVELDETEYIVTGFDSSINQKITVTITSIADPALSESFDVLIGDPVVNAIVSAVAAPVSVPKGTTAENLVLPFSIDVTLEKEFSNITQPMPSKQTKVPVVWNTETFDDTKLDEPQTIYGSLEITLGKAVEEEITLTELPIGNPNEIEAEIQIIVRDVQRELYVSPEAESGGNGSKDAPFNSIQAAKEAIANNGWNKNMEGDLLVWLGGGTYSVTEPIEFGVGDSGSNGYSIIYQAIPGEVPNLNGGIGVDGWKQWDENPEIYVAELNRDTKLRNLFVNGVEAKLTSTSARTCGPYGTVEISGNESWALDGGTETAGVLLKWDELGFTVDSAEELTNPEDIEIRQQKTWNVVTVGLQEIKSVTPGEDGGAPLAKAVNINTNPADEQRNRNQLDAIANQYSDRQKQGDTAFVLQQPYGAIAACLAWQCNFEPYFAYVDFWGNVRENTGYNTFVIQNSLELLKNPGEFYFDKAINRLYYYPEPGVDIYDSEIVAPLSEGLIRIEGNNTSERVENLQFSGIKFTYDDKGLEVVENSEGFASVQNMAAYTKYISNGDWHYWLYNNTDISKGTVNVENASGIVFTGNAFTTLSSGTCIGYINDVVDSQITGNVFMDTAGNAATIGHTQHVHIGEDGPPETTEDNKYPIGVEGICKNIIVSNNYIENTCTMFTQADALTALYAENVEFSHNRITNVPYSAINFGWGWQNQDDRSNYSGTHYPDYPSQTARKNTIVYNHIDNANQVLTEDGGALYTLGQQEDSIIAYNKVHGVRSVYTDEGTAYFEVFYNDIDSRNRNYSYNELWYGNDSSNGSGSFISWRDGNNNYGTTEIPSYSGKVLDITNEDIFAASGIESDWLESIATLKKLVASDGKGNTETPDNLEIDVSTDLEDHETGELDQDDPLLGSFIDGGVSVEEEDGNKVLRLQSTDGTSQHNGFYLKGIEYNTAVIELEMKFNANHAFTHDWESISVQGFASAKDGDEQLSKNESLFAGSYLDKSDKQTYHYNKGEAGVHMNGKQVDLQIEKESWYQIKIMVRFGNYYVKMWLKGQEEPEQWQLYEKLPNELGYFGTLRVTSYKHNESSNLDVSFDNIVVSKPVVSLSLGELQDNTATVGADYRLAIPYKYTGNQDVVFEAANLPEGLICDASSGIISGRPASGSEGNYEVKIKLTAGKISNSGSFKLTVKNDTVPAISPPANLNALIAGTTSIKVNWTAANESEGYEVWYSTSQNGSYTLAGTTTECAFIQNNLTMGRTYYYKVRAYKTVKDGKDYSIYTSVKSLTLPVPKPTAEIKPPSNLNASIAGAASMKVNWTATNGSEGYEVWYSTAQNGSYTLAGTTTECTFIQNNLIIGTTYYYKVRAYKTVKDGKDYSVYTSVKSLTLPVPKATNVKTASAGATSIKVTWKKVNGASGYVIYRSTKKGSGYKKISTIISGSKTSFTNKSLKNGKTYYYRVRAYKNVNSAKKYGSYSNVVYRKATLSKPAQVKTTAKKSSIKVNWKKVMGADKYEIYRAVGKKGQYKKVATLSSRKIAYTNKKLTKGRLYSYKIKAVQKVGDKTYRSAYSARKSAKIK
ncbi:fibronectin type III domain-containing protein [Robinsoniella peoriensis]|uniref:fibronectin type III domain-containing protein n=1 Tax=Robinsoniella peoriensis TaxID=180332 RepID=UPI00363F8333